MLYVFAIVGLFLAAAGIFFVVTGVRTILEDDPKAPTLFAMLFRSYSSMNKGFAGILAAAGVAIAILGGWMAYKALTGG
jgi:hypothetical protein